MSDSIGKVIFKEWNDALATLDPQKVVACYSDEAILIPTLSNQVRCNKEEIQDYFTQFLQKRPQGTIELEQTREISEDVVINSGIYTFRFDDDAATDTQARFTFLYKKEAQGWKILEHHSSLLPEVVA
ncbi:SgcJ/EcaC family oxidoreductase [Thaumasiovibrio subtropicus]|uniref:SgcJ/EcaC family oxidoreductase n=2 Tax=Thaumasiovibrio subtropicus TaxID=1891207 RepID=UPI001C85C85D|nr:SgcJ/EcaC family oxidoreductase [Thaumasiovibrio subtropicus]